MADPKADFLKECMSDVGQAPLDTFQRAFCAVCANRECARSAANNLSFDRRVLNWKRDLFDNVPRAADADPQYAQIRAKRFVSKEPAAGNVVSQAPRVDPRPEAAPEPEHSEAPAHSEPAQESPPEASPGVQAAPAAEPPPPAPPAPPGLPGASNTPFVQGTVLPGHAAPRAEDVEVEPGGSFTFGGGDE